MEKNEFHPDFFPQRFKEMKFAKKVSIISFNFHFLDQNGKSILKTFDFSRKCNVPESVKNIQEFYSELQLIEVV